MTADLDWSYTGLAAAYRSRPGYSAHALDECLRAAAIAAGMRACDVGAGTGNLTVPLLRRGLAVVAVEPNDDMRRAGVERTRNDARVRWTNGLAEALPFRDRTFDLLTFGSSLNVVERDAALAEGARVLAPGGWLVCVWNHRDLDDPLQRRIERVIRRALPDYRYGSRRADQTGVLTARGWFQDVRHIERSFVASVRVADFLAAWRSHVTLRRQARDKLPGILDGIGALLPPALEKTIAVPYTTRVWMARRSRAGSAHVSSRGLIGWPYENSSQFRSGSSTMQK